MINMKEVIMSSMLLGLWENFRKWVSVDWSAVTFAIVLSVFGICVLMLLSTFLKENFNKGKSIKWGKIVLLVILLGIMALLFYVRFTN